MTDDRIDLPAPPGSWSPARRLARRALAPIESILHVEAASGVALIAAAVIALVWANSPWRGSYEALFATPLRFGLGPWTFTRDLRFWINDGLMAIFFFVVGLEIRRELHRGVLSSLRRATLPLAAAVGGMLAPAAIFLALNYAQPGRSAWGVPMATDIAFAVGILSLLGPRVPPALRVLLLALAVVDDLGAIVVIALFYSSGLTAVGFLVAGAGLGAILLLHLLGVRRVAAYALPALVVWAGTYAAGVHPTVAGVIIGVLTPARPWLDREVFASTAAASIAQVQRHSGAEEAPLLAPLRALGLARREAISPLERLQHALHGWVAFGIMPLFALANAGVTLGGAGAAPGGGAVMLGVIAGLAAGKPLGVVLLAWGAVRLRLADLPAGIRWRHVALLGLVAGIGFTMALFIAQLALPGGALLEAAKLAILAASGGVAVLALVVGRLVLRPSAEGARSAAEAEGDEAPGGPILPAPAP